MDCAAITYLLKNGPMPTITTTTARTMENTRKDILNMVLLFGSFVRSRMGKKRATIMAIIRLRIAVGREILEKNPVSWFSPEISEISKDATTINAAMFIVFIILPLHYPSFLIYGFFN